MRVYAARPRHSQNRCFLPSLASKPLCRVVVLEYALLGNDETQRLSSGLVAQTAATYGVKHNHTNAAATLLRIKGRGRSESARHTAPISKSDVTLQGILLQQTNRSGKEEYCPLSYTKPVPPEHSSIIFPETSRNLQNLPDVSSLF